MSYLRRVRRTCPTKSNGRCRTISTRVTPERVDRAAVRAQRPTPDQPPADHGVVAEQFQASTSDARLAAARDGRWPQCRGVEQCTDSLVPAAGIVGRMLAKVRWLSEARQLPNGAVLADRGGGRGGALIPADFDIEAARRAPAPTPSRRVCLGRRRGQRTAGGSWASRTRRRAAGRAAQAGARPGISPVAGEMQTAEKKLAAVQAERLTNVPAAPDTRRNLHQLTADEEELKELLKGLRDQREFSSAAQRPRRRSPLDGQALTWNLKQLLEARPVQRGQTLLTVADLDGPWELELHLPDHRAGHVLAAARHCGRTWACPSPGFRAGHGLSRTNRGRGAVHASSTSERADGARDRRIRSRRRGRAASRRDGDCPDSLRPPLDRLRLAARSVRIRSISLVVVTNHESLLPFRLARC